MRRRWESGWIDGRRTRYGGAGRGFGLALSLCCLGPRILDKEPMSEAIEVPLTAEQLSKILPLHPVTILRWAREGKIPHKRLSPRKIVFMPSEIRAWLESKNGRIP